MALQKFTDLCDRLPKLTEVLCTSLQNDFLEIRKLDQRCDKFQTLAQTFPQIHDAVYVIFSKYIKRQDHEQETFVFIDGVGKVLCHISGRDIALYGMLEGCEFEVNEAFLCSWQCSHHGL